jgi:hypothetical protein
MGYGDEFINDSQFEQEKCYEYMDYHDYLNQFTDTELIEEAIRCGPCLNFDSFPTYDIAIKIKKNGWKMTLKQREAIINVMTHHHIFGGNEK